MLDQGTAPQQRPQPSSGPIAQTPPPPLPQGNSGGAPGPGHPAQGAPPQAAPPQAAPRQEPASQESFEKMRDQAIQLVYGERFDQLIKMFQNNGPDKFARSMAVAVNTPITELEKQEPMAYETAIKIGLAIYIRLLEDMLSGGVVKGVTAEQISETLPAILIMYADSHPEVTKEDLQKVVMITQQGMQDGAGEDAEDVDIKGILPGDE